MEIFMNKKLFTLLLTLILAVVWILVYNGRSAAAVAQPPPAISAEEGIVIDGDTGEVLFQKNADKKAYPASTTKILTALIAIETMEAWESDLSQKVKIPTVAVGVEGSSIYVAADEEISMEDLLYGMMLRSGNDAAVALAEIIGGESVDKDGNVIATGTENFVSMMNKRAVELGCKNSNFLNPNGLFDENHYTTVRDMAIISREAMKHESFRKIVGSEKWQAGRAPDKYNYFYNKNKVVHQYDGGNGIKIGYTKASGRTLVASAQRDGRQLICVVMNAPDWFEDAYKLMDYCFGGE